MIKVLIVDDDKEIRDLIEGVLSRNGIEVRSAADTVGADRVLSEFPANLIVLDLMMEGEDGLSYCRRLRRSLNIPIIMLTALSDDIDRIVGLEIGADDYLGKPFNPRELVARIKSVLRRAQPPSIIPKEYRPTCLRFGDFELFPEQISLKRISGEVIQLTSGEFALLFALVKHAPRVLSRDQLLDLSRGAAANPFDRSVDSQISRIRSKIETDPKRPEFIKTIRNLGYAFAADVRAGSE
jgi:two-component system, OmpR family, response regulator